MNVLPSTKPPKNSPSATGPSYSAIKTEYTTSPSSYGAEPPAILSVNRESRAVALCHLAAKFNCYWNLEIDTLYIEVKRWGADEAMKQLWDMRTRGLLDGFRHLSLDCDIWSSSKPEHWYIFPPSCNLFCPFQLSKELAV
jgi:hypothetical protein